ncbi:LacI family DNA-binding transcriptional regulator [Alkalibacterium sp. m-11]|uniref:LacI family DNA-binding transcriptional regulator n=1 Tax=Alkalibacterium indicireducens TaxID=398758 RepID=A0ABN1B700_9LACT
MKNTTIKDVAKKAEVSVTTVSRVLNNRGYISDEMKDKVMKAVDELNYTPNEIARSFFTNETKFIALIIPTTKNPYFGELTFHIEKLLAQNGYNLFICNSLNDIKNEKKYLKLLKERRVDGIIVGSHNIDISEYKNLENKIVSIEREITQEIPIIQSDNYLGGELATKELINNSCKSILCVVGDKNILTPANDRSEAYRKVVSEHGLKSNIIEIPFNYSFDKKIEIIKSILLTEKYDGVFAGDDVMAKLFINAAKDLGIEIPKKLKVIGFDGTEMIRLLNPEISTIRQPIDLLAKGAVEALINLINGREVEKQIIYPVELISSNTTRLT